MPTAAAMKELPIWIQSIQNGWITIKIDNLKVFGSYLDQDIPLEWLKTLKFAIKYDLPFCLTLDGEDQYTVISAGKHDTYVYNTNKFFYIVENFGYQLLAKHTYERLLRLKENMYNWFEEHITPEEYIIRKNEIDELIDEINALLLVKKM